jgi:hypothetical protein
LGPVSRRCAGRGHRAVCRVARRDSGSVAPMGTGGPDTERAS